MPFRKINATNTKGVLTRSQAPQSELPWQTRQCRIKLGKFQCDVSVSARDGSYTVTYHATNTITATFACPTEKPVWLIRGGWFSEVNKFGVPTKLFCPNLTDRTPAKLFNKFTKHLRTHGHLY